MYRAGITFFVTTAFTLGCGGSALPLAHLTASHLDLLTTLGTVAVLIDSHSAMLLWLCLIFGLWVPVIPKTSEKIGKGRENETNPCQAPKRV